MPFATWWRGDPLPELPPLPDFAVRRSTDRDLIERLNRLSLARVDLRLRSDNDFYVALLNEAPVGYGWVGFKSGAIDELFLRFSVPPGNAYLWDFATLPAWRGLGVYPHLIQEIARRLTDVERFWIAYEAHNTASGRGIEKAGFQVVGELVVERHRVTGFEAAGTDERSRAATTMLTPGHSTGTRL